LNQQNTSSRTSAAFENFLACSIKSGMQRRESGSNDDDYNYDIKGVLNLKMR
jgi:hypothetical protein